MVRLRFHSGDDKEEGGRYIVLHPIIEPLNLALDKFCWATNQKINRYESHFFFGTIKLSGYETPASLSMPPIVDIFLRPMVEVPLYIDKDDDSKELRVLQSLGNDVSYLLGTIIILPLFQFGVEMKKEKTQHEETQQEETQHEENYNLREWAKLMLNTYWGKVCYYTLLHNNTLPLLSVC